MRYPYALEKDGEDWLVRFRNVPEALTSVSRRDDHAEMQDCLITALAGYAKQGRRSPPPSKPASDRSDDGFIHVPTLVQAKLELIRRLGQSTYSQKDLAAMLGVDPKQVQRLLNLNHRSHIGEVEAALAKFGADLTVKVA